MFTERTQGATVLFVESGRLSGLLPNGGRWRELPQEQKCAAARGTSKLMKASPCVAWTLRISHMPSYKAGASAFAVKHAMRSVPKSNAYFTVRMPVDIPTFQVNINDVMWSGVGDEVDGGAKLDGTETGRKVSTRSNVSVPTSVPVAIARESPAVRL